MDLGEPAEDFDYEDWHEGEEEEVEEGLNESNGELQLGGEECRNIESLEALNQNEHHL